MSKIGNSLFALLNSDSNITDIIGFNSVYMVVCTDEKKDNFILVHLESVAAINDNDSYLASGDYTYRLTLVLDDYDNIQTLRNHVVNALNGYAGVQGVNDIRDIRYINEKDGYANDLKRYLRMIDFEISVNE